MRTDRKTAPPLTAELLQRVGRPNDVILSSLGYLSGLPGTWAGSGFNLIARPNKQNHSAFFLQLNATRENLEFSTIGGLIPNRGSEQGDIFLQGLHYLQQVSDAATNAPLHIEPGLWIHVPPTQAPPQNETYVRQSTIPHGDSVLAQDIFSAELNTGPALDPVDAFPFVIKPGVPIPGLNQVPNPDPVPGLGYIDPYLDPRVPAGMTTTVPPAVFVRNPVTLLAEAISGQDIVKTVVIQVSSANTGGIVNIPFVVKNANAVQLDAIFWIETVAGGGMLFDQLQYVQRVVLDFDGIHWPHFSVATLKKQ